MSRLSLVLLVSLLVAQPASGIVAYPERSNGVLTAELLLGGANVFLGVDNWSKGQTGDRSLAWALVGVGTAALGIGLSTLDNATVAHFDLIASGVSLAGSAFRIRGPFPGNSRLEIGYRTVRLARRF